MDTEDIIKLSALSDSGQASGNDDSSEEGSIEPESQPLSSQMKDDVTGKAPTSLTDGAVEFMETSMVADGTKKISMPVGLESSESVSVMQNLVAISSVNTENGSLAVPNERSFGDLDEDEVLLSDKDKSTTLISGVKRPQTAVNEQEPSVHIVYTSLTRESKQKLEELLQQWSRWHAQNCSSSNGSDMVLISGEETYFPALSIDLDKDKPSAVAFWMDNHAKSESNKEYSLGGASVPLYDRGYSLALTADGNISGGKEVDPSRCFNCGSYSHAMKECPKPHDRVAVRNARKLHKSKKIQKSNSYSSIRYYQSSSEGKYHGLTPGVLDAETRKLLGLGEFDPPPWLNRMREIGYPPGYLDSDMEDQPSGITIFGEEPSIIEGEEGEILDTTAISKPPKIMTVKFPGINAPIPENADERLWAPPDTFSVDTSRDHSRHRYKNSSENTNRPHYSEQRWRTDYEDVGPPGSDRTRYNSSSEDFVRGWYAEKRFARDFEDDGPPGCEPGTSPSLSNNVPRYRDYASSRFSPRDSSGRPRSPSYGRSWSDSRQRSPPRYNRWGNHPYSSPR